MENSELKAKTKNVYQIIKALDEHKQTSKTISSLFSDIGVEVLRKKLVILIESILLEDFETIGKKTRDILWRKMYYDPISTSKKLWKKSERELTDSEATVLYEFIKSGIKHYKTLILKFEDIFNLDIRYIIDFSIIANGADPFEKRSEKEIYTVNETNHAIETIHNFLISLGDLHRYCIEFKFAEREKFLACGNKQLAASYYIEAFKLNPKVGMPHNQLGTLLSGENYEIDSIFHYLYSLCSPIPVELSEANVSKIFQQNNEMLVTIEPSCDGFNIRDFMMQVILLIDIFFYDKEIVDFNSICFSVLLNFKDYLIKCNRNSQSDVTFQLTSIFMLCLLKLKRNNSPKVQCLNAFLVAFCAKIVDIVIEKIDDYIAEHKNENLEFVEEYNRKYYEFDKQIKRARDINRNQKSKQFGESLKDSGIEKNGSSNSQKDGSGSNRMSNESKVTMSQSSGKSQPGDIKIVKRPQPQQSNANNNHRRRRKRRGFTESTSSDESETESLFSEDNSDVESMNSDFDSYDEDDFHVKMRFSSDEDSEEDDDDDDILIESEEIVYKKNEETPNQLTFHEENSDDIIVEEEKIVFQEEQPDEEIAKMLKMKYKKKYTKVDPNLILEFSKIHEGWMKSLKILFDWLHLDNETIESCYRSNPEFIGKIIRLMNFINIDIFTRKIYFDRSMIKFKNVREDLRYIFDNRHQIATTEDIIFKKNVIFEELQQTIDWNLNYKLQITPEEDVILRIFKMIDFGFHLIKIKKFNYNFCARSRVFIEKTNRRRSRKTSDDSRRKFKNEERGNRRERKRNRRRKRREERKLRNSESDRFERLSIKTHSQGSQEIEEFPSIEKSNQCSVRKGYLSNKIAEREKSEAEKKEMMGKLGKLWLKNEVQTLESRSKPVNTNMTPFLMLDTNALTDYLYVVKALVKTKKFIVLIPKAVLQDIDGLKKNKESARNAIKWLETEFQKGNRFLRTQRDSEILQMPYLKVPSKLEREDAVFMNIVPFANFIVSNNTSDCGSDLPILTLLTGENLDTKKSSTTSNINQIGILQSIPVKYDQIYRFFSKYKKK
ncbi:hypothetical protein PVAND_005203 [Polypedilum vanderplanki]|uniref:PIN domain-containing protein n=1 Tax=Polypedilum vanderplanki TaxID=319348 RepID=A0A9J6C0F2_POLVA|nr:hypothetical protein PVAND_005203 [Polypedilum vanderplanki]